MAVKRGVLWATVWSVCLITSFLLLAAAGAGAQTPPAQSPPPPASPQPKPVTGFVPPFEIMRTVRAAGFDPLVPPLREGTIYVLRATDFRGILMRVVLDARTGAIRDVNRIVSAASGPDGMMPPYGAPAPHGMPPYGSPAEFEAPAPGMGPAEDGALPQLPQPVALPAATHPASSTRPFSPPLPRPRPAALASRKPEKLEKTEKTEKTEKPAARANSANAEPRTGLSAGPQAAPRNAPPVAPLND